MNEKCEVSYLVFTTFLATWLGVVIFGFKLFTEITDPLLPSFTIAMMCFSIANIFVLYNTKKRMYTFLVLAYVVSALHLLAIYFARTDLSHIVLTTLYLATAYVLLMFIMHINKKYFIALENNINAFFDPLSSETIRNISKL